jgi:hypothetical protein
MDAGLSRDDRISEPELSRSSETIREPTIAIGRHHLAIDSLRQQF